jgi:transcriptional repressor NrdR
VNCPYCGAPETRVIDSRDAGSGGGVRRRRACERCKQRFTTYERVEALPLVIRKKDGRREEFDRQKLYQALWKACSKRHISPEQVDEAVRAIERELRRRGGGEVPSEAVGELAMEQLRSLDQVAYIRFASVYRAFMDLAEVRAEIDKLLSRAPERKG